MVKRLPVSPKQVLAAVGKANSEVNDALYLKSSILNQLILHQ